MTIRRRLVGPFGPVPVGEGSTVRAIAGLARPADLFADSVDDAEDSTAVAGLACEPVSPGTFAAFADVAHTAHANTQATIVRREARVLAIDRIGVAGVIPAAFDSIVRVG
jgi:hypothetical protein